MIISDNRKPKIEEFKSLVDCATDMLNNDAAGNFDYYSKQNGQRLESDVEKFLNKAAEHTEFKGTIKTISGQSFPDIEAAGYYGVEVKSSASDKWTTIGSSVNESTRKPGIERIFLTYGKLAVDPVRFISRPYEECLYDIVVTHSPRYKIDMELEKGKTIFDEMGIEYDDMRKNDPIGEFVKYYNKNRLPDGESLWWTGKNLSEEISDFASTKIRFWEKLNTQEQDKLRASGLVLYPKIFVGNYQSFTLWLATIHNVVSHSLRDKFSAGGKDVILGLETFGKIPRVFINTNKLKNEIISYIKNVDENLLKETWGVEEIKNNRLKQWISLMPTTHNYNNDEFPVREIVKAIFS